MYIDVDDKMYLKICLREVACISVMFLSAHLWKCIYIPHMSHSLMAVNNSSVG